MRSIRVTTRALLRDEMESLLARHHVGRMAFSFHDRVSLRLVNYAYAAGWIYARMEASDERTVIAHNQWIAFEVDEVQGIYDWRTVTVHGSTEFLSDDAQAGEGQEFRAALQMIRSVVPSVLTAKDPMPERVQLFRIHVSEMVGSEARSDAQGVLPAP
jgi:uncharacterized protein